MARRIFKTFTGKLSEGFFQLEMLKSKLHRARITAANLHYEGSLSIAEDLMKAVRLLPHEKILCANLSTGARFETYVIKAPEGSGRIVLNGATAHLGKEGDMLTILSFMRLPFVFGAKWEPRTVTLLEGNRLPQ